MRLFLLLIFMMLLCSCEDQQTLCFNHPEHAMKPVEVVFDWSLHPEASPRSMSLYLFPESGGESRRYEFTDRDGGTIYIPPGRYSAIAVNSDTEHTKVRGSSYYDSFELWLREDFAVGRIAEERLTNPSDMIWSAAKGAFDPTSESRIVLTMGEAVCRCSVEVRHITGCERISSVRATLSGMNESVMVARQSGGERSVTIGFDMERTTDSRLTGRLLTLGHCGAVRLHGRSCPGSKGGDTPTPHQLSLYVTLADGTGWKHVEDVGSQIHNQDISDCHILIDSLAVPEVGSGGGFDFSVDEWEEVHINIKP